MEGDQFVQAGPAFPKSTLAGLESLVALHMLCDGTEDELFRDLPRL